MHCESHHRAGEDNLHSLRREVPEKARPVGHGHSRTRHLTKFAQPVPLTLLWERQTATEMQGARDLCHVQIVDEPSLESKARKHVQSQHK
eukprot:4720040-Amphidinium_carterae.1